MRTLKFRIWCHKLNEFWSNETIQRDRLAINPATGNIYKGDYDCDLDYIATDGVTRLYTVQQFSGLKDKNGKEIYEGDIVDYWDDDEFYVVIFKYGQFYMDRLDNGGIGDFKNMEKQTKVEIIGNILENPEFSKEDEATF
jgi:uncharacterized phage protein (TIGR01671 family)